MILDEEVLLKLPESLETIELCHISVSCRMKPTNKQIKYLRIDNCRCDVLSNILEGFSSGIGKVIISPGVNFPPVCEIPLYFRGIPHKIRNCELVGEFHLFLSHNNTRRLYKLLDMLLHSEARLTRLVCDLMDERCLRLLSRFTGFEQLILVSNCFHF